MTSSPERSPVPVAVQGAHRFVRHIGDARRELVVELGDDQAAELDVAGPVETYCGERLGGRVKVRQLWPLLDELWTSRGCAGCLHEHMVRRELVSLPSSPAPIEIEQLLPRRRRRLSWRR